MRSDGKKILQILQREQWSNRSLPHNLRYQDPKFCCFHSDIRRKKISRSLLHSLCPHDPWDSLIFSLQIHFFLFFFLLIYFKWDPKEKNLQIFRCSDLHNPIRRFFNTLDPTVFYHPRSDGFLALQIRRFFDFSPPNSPWIFDYQNQAGCGTRKIWTQFK